MAMILHLIKIAFRNFLKNKSYYLINILGLTTGLTAFILLNLYVNFEESWDSFHKDAEKMYRIEPIVHLADIDQYWSQTPGPISGTIKEKYPEVENALCVRETWGEYLSIPNEEPFYEKNGFHAENSIFDFFDFDFLYGSAKNALTEPNTIVITKEIADKYFKEENPIGKTIIGNSKFNYKITGVVDNPKKNFHLNGSYYISMASFKNNMDWDLMNDWYSFSAKSYIKLKDNKNLEDLKAKIKNELNNNNESVKTSLLLINLKDMHLLSGNDRGLQVVVYLLSATSFLILLLAGINFMNLTTAFSSTRNREIGLRKVLGSTRPKIARQFIGESLGVTMISLILAFGLAELLLPTFNTIINRELEINYTDKWQFTLFLISTATILGIISSILPALKMSALSPINALKGIKTKKIARKFTLKKALIIFQIHISIVFVFFTIENYRQYKYYDTKDLGFDKENLVICNVSESENIKVKDWRILRNQFLSNPIITNASMSYNAPYNGSDGRIIDYEGAGSDEKLSLRFNRVDPYFIDTYKMDIIKGRNFYENSETDSASCIVNEKAVKAMGYNDPIGKKIWNKQFTIIGVVKDFHETSPYMRIQPYIMIKRSNDLKGYKRFNIKVKEGELEAGIHFIKETLREYFPDQMYQINTFADSTSSDEAYKVYQSMSKIFIFFSIIAVIIAIVGLFALVAYSAKSRVKEIGIRKVLGAASTKIYSIMAREYFILLIIAMGLAVLIDIFTQDLNPSFYKPEPDYWTHIYIFVGAMVIISLTISSQIIKTSRTNPVKSLKYE